VFEFVAANQADHPITMMCALLEVSTSGFYAWRSRPLSSRAVADAQLTERIIEIHNANRQVYGRPRIHAELTAEGTRVSGKRVARLMRAEGICGASRRKKWRTAKRDRDARPAPDLVDRDFTVQAADQLWVADITYVPTWAGFVYLAVVLDAWSRRVIGWAMADTLHTQVVLDALNMALWQRRPADVVHHSDQGCQYTSIAFGLRCREAGVRPSMGSVGDAYDNAMAESFFATLETECLEQRRFRTRNEARFELVSFIEGFYNRRRRHSALDYQSPVDYERNHAA
jgi:putative transposase